MKFRPFNSRGEVLRHRGSLPHWRQQGATYFITGRLGDALPQAKLRQWARERVMWLRSRGLRSADEVEKLSEREQWRFREWFSARIHRWLDAGYGECWMKRPDIAQMVAEALLFGDGKSYALDAWVVMPNHVHALLTPLGEFSLGEINRSWRGFSARQANKRIGRTGGFWQEESWDRIVRNEDELFHWRRYIAQNPAKAHLREGTWLVGMGCGLETEAKPSAQ